MLIDCCRHTLTGADKDHSVCKHHIIKKYISRNLPGFLLTRTVTRVISKCGKQVSQASVKLITTLLCLDFDNETVESDHNSPCSEAQPIINYTREQ